MSSNPWVEKIPESPTIVTCLQTPPLAKFPKPLVTSSYTSRGVDNYSSALQSNRAVHTVCTRFENMSGPGDIRNAIADMFSRPDWGM